MSELYMLYHTPPDPNLIYYQFFIKIGISIAAFIMSIIVHEFGHYLVFRIYGYKIRIRYYFDSIWKFGLRAGDPNDYKNLSHKQIVNINIGGIAAGAIFLMILDIALSNYHIPIFFLIIPYLIGCKKDINLIEQFI